jgi:F0F1-type ATP synthase membrane subunit b/b'
VAVQLWLLIWVGVGAIFLILASAFVVFYWLLSHYRRHMETANQQQMRLQQQLDQADEHQLRSLELINRAESFFARAESLLARLENKSGA